MLSLSRSRFIGKRQCQLSCGVRNFRFTEATETASSCVMDAIFRIEFAGAGNGVHDGALRRFEYHRDLILAGTWLDFKGAPWKWLMYSHVTALRPAWRAFSRMTPTLVRNAVGQFGLDRSASPGTGRCSTVPDFGSHSIFAARCKLGSNAAVLSPKRPRYKFHSITLGLVHPFFLKYSRVRD